MNTEDKKTPPNADKKPEAEKPKVDKFSLQQSINDHKKDFDKQNIVKKDQ